MRNLFLALVLANLAFAAWSAWFAPAARVGRPADDGLPALTLVSEVPADLRSSGVVVEQRGAAQDAAEPPTDAVAGAVASAERRRCGREPPGDEAPAAARAGASSRARCTSVGPFRELSQAATAAATLRTAGYQPLQRVAEGDIWIGYWVYIPAIRDRAAKRTRSSRRSARRRHHGLLCHSEQRQRQSRLARRVQRDQRRQPPARQVRALGFEPQVVDRTRRATVYWVDVALAAGQALDFDALQPPGRIIRLEQRACEAPGLAIRDVHFKRFFSRARCAPVAVWFVAPCRADLREEQRHETR